MALTDLSRVASESCVVPGGNREAGGSCHPGRGKEFYERLPRRLPVAR